MSGALACEANACLGPSQRGASDGGWVSAACMQPHTRTASPLHPHPHSPGRQGTVKPHPKLLRSLSRCGSRGYCGSTAVATL